MRLAGSASSRMIVCGAGAISNRSRRECVVSAVACFLQFLFFLNVFSDPPRFDLIDRRAGGSTMLLSITAEPLRAAAESVNERRGLG